MMARVWAESPHGGSELLVLLAIADHADDDGNNAYPSVASLANKCRMSTRNANLVLAALRRSGALEVRENEGPRGTNRYRLIFGLAPSSPLKPASPPEASFTLKPASPTPEAGFLKPLKPASDEPSLNHQEPPLRAKRSRGSVDQKTFGDWYAQEKAIDPNVLRDDDPVYAYLQSVGLSNDFMLVAWHWFKRKHMASSKLQKSWPLTFLNYVRGNYGRLWFLSEGGVWMLTTTGKQVAIENRLHPHMQSSSTTQERAAADPDSRSAIEADGERLGIGTWQQIDRAGNTVLWSRYVATVKAARKADAGAEVVS